MNYVVVINSLNLDDAYTIHDAGDGLSPVSHHFVTWNDADCICVTNFNEMNIVGQFVQA